MHTSHSHHWGQYNPYLYACVAVENTLAWMACNAEKMTVDLNVDVGRDDDDYNIDYDDLCSE